MTLSSRLPNKTSQLDHPLHWPRKNKHLHFKTNKLSLHCKGRLRNYLICEWHAIVFHCVCVFHFSSYSFNR
ncbi:hypothetical protein MtrunA17_Chr2g0296241 [Medicago truncatula]|uniref:Uncharacterized protein n=1 Tax=Medicago truncatula TaxID=3880 RepID=A0A396J555_MEDTR|nr:hypothetical protein MtrunA17_Chr2g0296241 [Medicago truncatula]